jgi:DNA-binding MarR family transcriptional regulator
VAEETSDRLSNQVLSALRRIIRATDLHSRQLLREFGITGPQLMALRTVGTAGELSASALAAALNVSLPTATDIAGRLEKRGLAARRRGSADKRQVLVSLTNAGRAILASAPPPLRESFTMQLEAMPEWEQSQVLSVLQRIVAMMETDGEDASPLLSAREPAEAAEE